MMMITVIALDHWDDNDNGFDDGSDHNGDGCCGSVPPFFNFFQAIDPGTICQLRSETWKNHHLFKHNLNSPWKKHVAGNCFMWKLSFRHEFIIKPVWASTSPPLDLCRGLLVPKYISTHKSCLGLIWPWFLDAIASSRCYPCDKSNVAVERLFFKLSMDPLVGNDCPISIFSGLGGHRLSFFDFGQ